MDDLYSFFVYFYALSGNNHTQIFDSLCQKFALVNIDLQFLFMQAPQHLQHLTCVIFFFSAIDQYIVQINGAEYIKILSQWLINIVLEGTWSVA